MTIVEQKQFHGPRERDPRYETRMSEGSGRAGDEKDIDVGRKNAGRTLAVERIVQISPFPTRCLPVTIYTMLVRLPLSKYPLLVYMKFILAPSLRSLAKPEYQPVYQGRGGHTTCHHHPPTFQSASNAGSSVYFFALVIPPHLSFQILPVSSFFSFLFFFFLL